MYKFFVTEEQIENNKINIVGEDVNHIKNVLRLQINEEIEICSINNSTNYLCKILQLTNKNIECKIIKSVESNRESQVYLHIFQGLPKSEKMEMIIQKTTEIGVSEITPIVMERCIVKLDNKSKEKKLTRWKKIAEVAAKQSKRDKIPIINDPINIECIYEKVKNYDIVLVAYENEQVNTIKNELRNISKKNRMNIAVIIGPEGGIDKEEIKILKEQGMHLVSLGKRILRTETAPIVLSSIIMYELD